MAKSKKTESAAAEKTDKKPAAATEAKAKAAAPKAAEKKAPAKKGAATKSAAPVRTDVPQIDTDFAAQSAAKTLMSRATGGGGGGAAAAQGQTGKESAAFKSMKDNIAKPKASSSLSHLLGPTVDAKKSASHFLNQQKGHNQTAGGFNKTGVPRRTNG